MELKWLKTFLLAAKYENFRKAADELFVSQPTVTVHIQLLEKELGCKLFKRDGRQIMLTEVGRSYIVHAQKLLFLYEDGIAEVNRIQQGYQTKLTLAVSPEIASSILPALIRSYLNLYPTIDLDIQVVESIDIPELIIRGEADIGLSRQQFQMKGLSCIPLQKDQVKLIVPHDGFDPETGPPLEVDDLFQNKRLIVHSHPEYWEDLLPLIKSVYPHIKTMFVSQVHVTKRFIEEGLGISFLPISIVQRELLEGRLLEVETPDFPKISAQSYALTKYESDEINRFIHYISQYRI
ncbi:LysR family transcriptional repressor of citA [Bacillus oleivorans]|uniref:LysR family transcriptional repressor of citA n=1 Tax=Bacillus oleivorans TaxID=1448271 RepID=A0A285D3Y2_9BACI|nr:LysR family transcriptional regulator [Bacillus oleivorans]SNX74537.1 LysR family transcriptional repressor of citA [Bacillus oleivorans]